MRKNEVDVFLLDVYIDVCDGFSVLTIMKNLHLKVPTIIVSATDRISVIRQTINLGAKAFVHKNQDAHLLGEAIVSVFAGELFYSEKTLQTLEIVRASKAKQTRRKIQFSEKDLLILSYLLNGLTSKEIAHYLFLSPRTVEAHRSKLMRKTETKSMLELAKYVTKNKVKLIGKV
jgi:DNA-binding NarL/FixJ family response regulator